MDWSGHPPLPHRYRGREWLRRVRIEPGNRFSHEGHTCRMFQWPDGLHSLRPLTLYGSTSRGRLLTSKPRSSRTLMRVLPFIMRPSDFTLRASGCPGPREFTMSAVSCLRQYSSVARFEPASRVWSEWMRRSGGFTVRYDPGIVPCISTHRTLGIS